MVSVWSFFVFCSCSLPIAHSTAQGRSFLASAWRASRSSSAEQWWLSRNHDANDALGSQPSSPAPAGAPPPSGLSPPPQLEAGVDPPLPPRPEPLPPTFPVMSQEKCELFQEGFLVRPSAVCAHVIYAENYDGCTCSLVLPGNVNPQPANLYNPYLPEIPADGSVPLPAAMPTVPPPSNPMQPYVAPMMPPECPFVKPCADPDSFDCVGYNSWGFAEAGMAGYMPASASLNSASCTYIMKPYGEFKVPRRMKALWHLNAKQKKVFERLSEPFVMKCVDQEVSSPSQRFFCNEKIQRLKFSCETTWEKVAKATAKACVDAPAPPGFVAHSTLRDLCPMHCGWKKDTIKWPPLGDAASVTTAEAA